MLYPHRKCVRDGCGNIIINAKRHNRMYCSEYCNKRTWDLKNRTPKKYSKIM